MRNRPAIFLGVVLCAVFLLAWMIHALAPRQPSPSASPATADAPPVLPRAKAGLSHGPSAVPDNAPTNIFAHNLMLRKGPQFRVYIQWLRGKLSRSHGNVTPSFDDPESFFLDIENGILRANIGDIGNYLNASGGSNLPLSNIKLSGDGDRVKLSGTFHKIIPLPIELTGTLTSGPGNNISVNVTKINVLKVPFKALLSGLHVTVSDLFHSQPEAGIEVSGNDIVFDTQKLLPPPHIRGHLTSVRIANPDLEEVYGNTTADLERTEQWRNFLRLRDGSLDFGKLTMHQVDLIMIDVSNDAWFDLDLAHYQDQLVNGYTRMTPQEGLQIFMPDLKDVPKDRAAPSVSIEWFKNRRTPPPAEIRSKK